MRWRRYRKRRIKGRGGGPPARRVRVDGAGAGRAALSPLVRCLRTCALNIGGGVPPPLPVVGGSLAAARARPQSGACAPGFFGMRRAFRFRPGSVPAPVRARRPSLGAAFPPVRLLCAPSSGKGRARLRRLRPRASPLPPAPRLALRLPSSRPGSALARRPALPLRGRPSLLPARGGAVGGCRRLFALRAPRAAVSVCVPCIRSGGGCLRRSGPGASVCKAVLLVRVEKSMLDNRALSGYSDVTRCGSGADIRLV